MQHRVRVEDRARRETVGQKPRVAGLDQLRRQPRDRNQAEPAHGPTQPELVAGEGGRPKPGTHDLEPLLSGQGPRPVAGGLWHAAREPPTLLLQPVITAVSCVDVFSRSIGQPQPLI
jgi:hypothetical protein